MTAGPHRPPRSGISLGRPRMCHLGHEPTDHVGVYAPSCKLSASVQTRRQRHYVPQPKTPATGGRTPLQRRHSSGHCRTLLSPPSDSRDNSATEPHAVEGDRALCAPSVRTATSLDSSWHCCCLSTCPCKLSDLSRSERELFWFNTEAKNEPKPFESPRRTMTFSPSLMRGCPGRVHLPDVLGLP